MANTLNVRLQFDTTQFERSIRLASNRLNAFARSAQDAGSTLTQSLTLPLVGVAGASIKAFADMEKLRKGMIAITGSAEAADVELQALREVARLPGLGFEEAVRGSINLQAVGLSADQARETLGAFGAAIAATGGGVENLESVNRQLTQILSKNRILSEDIIILQENVPLLGSALQGAFGTQNIEAIRESGVSAQDFVQRISEALKILPETQNATGGLANAFENFSDSAKTSGAQIGEVIARSLNLEGVLNKVSGIIQNVADGFSNLSPTTQRVIVIFGAVAAAAGPLLIALGGIARIVPILLDGVGALKTVFSALISPVGLVVAGILALVTAAIYLYNRFEIVRKIINGTIEGFKALGRLAIDVAGNIANGFRQIGEGNFRDALKSFAAAGNKQSFANIGKTFAEGFSEGFEDGTNRLKKTIDDIKKNVTQASQIKIPTLPGGSTDGTGRSTSATSTSATPQARQTLDATTLNGIALATQNVTAQTDILTEAFARARAAGEGVIQSLANFQAPSELLVALGDATIAASNAFADLAAQGETSLKKLGQAALQAARQIISAYIREGVAGIVKNILAGPTGKALGPVALAVAGAAGGAAALLFNTLLSKVSAPKLAKGGLAYAPTLATVGDNPNARVDPEVIAPLSKLRSLLDGAGGGNMIAEARISGNDLLLLVERAQLRQNRVR